MASIEDTKDQSMEEILQSIKRIIADEDEAPEPVSAKTSEEKPAAVTGSDVLELRDLVEEGPITPVPPTQPEKNETPDKSKDVLNAIDEGLHAAATMPPPVEENKDVLAGIDSLLSSETVKASSSALMNLKQQAHKTDIPVRHNSDAMDIAFRSGTTLEELVVEALRPELKNWLNAHLPEIVERMVAAEIKKITQD